LDSPCANDFKQAASVTVPPLLGAGLVTAATKLNPGGLPGAQADGSVANAGINLGGTVITAQVAEAEASAQCLQQPGQRSVPTLQGASNVVGLQINGQSALNTSQPVTIPLNPLITIYLNRTVGTPGQVVTQRAVEVSSPLLATDIVLGEATADITACHTIRLG
jgi:hypothetical protein